MENRFLAMNEYLSGLTRTRGAGGGLRAKGPASGSFGVPLSFPSGNRRFSSAFTASQRTLVVLIENGGVDLGIPGLVDALLDGLPGSSLIPQAAKSALVAAIRSGLRGLTDQLLETAELTINRYAGAKPQYFGEVVILRNSTALYENLRDTLIRLTEANQLIDLLVLTHGGVDSIAVAAGTHIRGTQIRDIRRANGGRPVHLRSVYMMNCQGSSLNDDWLALGAKASAGSFANNYLPEPTTFYFFRNWKAGQSFNDAVTNAYRSTIESMKLLLRSAGDAALPGFGGALAERLADLEHRSFVLDSRPVFAGETSLSINSDSLAFTASVQSLSYTIMPLGRALEGPPHERNDRSASNECIELIKSFEGFRARLYDDPAGHCTIGYGTLVHRGRCNGDASEAPYADGISEQRGVELVRQRAADFERLVNGSVQRPLNQTQFDALVSFSYNIGSNNFRNSTLLRKLNQGVMTAVPSEMKRWVHANGERLPGLVRRRDIEARLFSDGVYSTGQSWVRPFDGPRGIRNNNPGNIRISGENWEGKLPRERNTDGSFEQFSSFAHGVRALLLLLSNYIRGGRNTLRKVVAAYAPPSENDTHGYTAFLMGRLRAGGLDVGEDSPLRLDRTTLRLLAQGVGRMENGVECISDSQFEDGFALLSDEVRSSIAQSFAWGASLYRGFGEADGDTEEGELEDTGVGARQMSIDVPTYCPLNAADDARTQHFSLAEFTSHDGTEVPRQIRGNVQRLMEQLEVLRAELGSSIRVVSGYRSPEQNRRVEGKARSQHMCGTAADIQVEGVTPADVHARIESLIQQGRMLQGGLGLYRTFVHYDIRGTRARW